MRNSGCGNIRLMADESKTMFDPEVPNPARMYDCFLGGSHNFAVDRAAAARVLAVMPWAVDAVRANRFFLNRAVRFCVSEGIDQFLDLGSGIPAAGSVHETAQALAPRARVAYVDNEPVTVTSATALLDDVPLTTITDADLRDPDAVFDAPGVRDLLDLTRPVALLTGAVLHYVPDEARPASLIAHYHRSLAPGSVHVLSHATADHDPAEMAEVRRLYGGTGLPLTFRARSDVAALFCGAQLVEPGLVDATEWRPQDTVGTQHRGFWAGIGRIH
jgi:SAM-dependent methyltransferase